MKTTFIKLLRITTVPISIHVLINGQPNYMQKHGFDVQLACANGKEIKEVESETGIEIKILPLTREISPFTDAKALWKTYLYFKQEKPEIVHSHTPKAGIIGMLAANFAKVPIRMHTVAGLPLLETTGIKRKVLNFVEKLTTWSATNVYPNSFALKEIMTNNKLAPPYKLEVIGNGSSNGIDTEFFSVESVKKKIKPHYKRNEDLRSVDYLKKIAKDPTTTPRFGRDDIVFCFVGRIVKDKGINELLSAFDILCKENKNVKLLLVGAEEKDLDPINSQSQKILKINSQIISVGWQDDVRPFLAISDVFVFPSYREGFPNVVMQAGAMGLPSIVTNINGSNEIIEDGVNGIVIPVKDENALFDKMKLLADDKKLRLKLAEPARQMIIEKYEQKYVWNELLREYKRLLDENGIEHDLVE